MLLLLFRGGAGAMPAKSAAKVVKIFRMLNFLGHYFSFYAII